MSVRGDEKAVPAIAMLLHVGAVEVHEDNSAVDLHHSILQPRCDAQLLLRTEDYIRALVHWKSGQKQAFKM